MFVDVAKITIKSGNGGNGAVAFRREAFVPRGGPNGGDGGRGGDVLLEADESLRTLLDLRYKRKHFAGNGEQGSGNLRAGKRGEDLLLRVPVGTLVRDAATGRVLCDLRTPGARIRLLRGGRGGWGNARFATATRQTPAFAQPGQKTQPHEVILELKSIADVGLVGYPNVGKSTLLAQVTQARPKIANYPFTTLVPNLGVARVDDSAFHIADIPGLIENAHQGVGLGHDFLRHVERTRLLVHVIDASGSEGRDPAADYRQINDELRRYSAALAERPQIVAANKCDLPDAQAHLEALRDCARQDGRQLFTLSAATGQGVRELMRAVAALLRTLPTPELPDEPEPVDELPTLQENTFTVRREGDRYIVEGPMAEQLLDSVNFEDMTSMEYFERRLEQSGIVQRLRELGADHGDTVYFADMEFEFWD